MLKKPVTNQLFLKRMFSLPGEPQTLGHLFLKQNGNLIFECVTLERPWLDNKKGISCIPKGTYEVVKRISTKEGSHFHLLNVPGRDMILIHSGNFFSQSEGCILVGSQFKLINQDNFLDVSNSKGTLLALITLLPEISYITIQ